MSAKRQRDLNILKKENVNMIQKIKSRRLRRAMTAKRNPQNNMKKKEMWKIEHSILHLRKQSITKIQGKIKYKKQVLISISKHRI